MLFLKKLLEVVQLLSIEIYSSCASVEFTGTSKMEILQYNIRHHLLKMLLHKCKTNKYEIACKPTPYSYRTYPWFLKMKLCFQQVTPLLLILVGYNVS